MAIRETLILDLSQALSQLDDLERSLDSLIQPIVIPVEVETDQALEQLKRDIREADADDIDIDVDVEGVERAEDEFEDLRREVDKTDDGLEKVERQAKKTGDDLERAGKKGKSSFSGLTKGVLAFGAALGGIAALRGLLTFFGDAIDAASDLEESTSKAQVVFGSFFDDIEAFSQTAPQALRLSNAAALEFLGTFGNLFVALGLTQEAAADLSPEIVQLGADLASFNNIETTEALDKLRAGLVGEAEPLRALGVNITAVTTAAKAMELGLADSNGVVSEAAKVQARWALILEQTVTAQGDVAFTADTVAGRTRTLAGEFENLRATLGEALTPVFETLLSLGPDLVNAIEDGLVPAFESFAAAVASIDTVALGLFLAQAPTIAGGTVSIFNSIAQGLVNVAQAVLAVIRVDRADFLAQSIQGIEDFNRVAATQTASKAINNLIVSLSGGAEPAAALESVLAELGESVSNLNLEQFQGLVDQLLAIADLPNVELERLARLLREVGPAAGFSAGGVDILVASLLEVRDFSGVAPADLKFFARVLDLVGQAAADAAPGIVEFGAGSAILADSLRRGEVNAAIGELEAQFETLPGVIGAAADAIKTEGGKVIDNFADFAVDFREVLEELEAFEFNLLILRALGLDPLADIFEGLGAENAAQLAADAVLDQAAAQEMSDIIAGRVKVVGPDMINSVAESIISEPVTEALIAAVIEGARDANTPAARQAALDLANALTVTIPITFGDFPPLTVAEAIVVSEGIDIEAGLRGTTIVQNFDNTPSPTTETERAAQAIMALVGAE